MESVIECAPCAPRRAARIASSPQPVPISSTRVPSPTPGLVEQPVDLAELRGLAGRPRPARRPPGSARRMRRCRRAPRSSSGSGRGTARTGRWTGRSGGRCCRGTVSRRCCGGSRGALGDHERPGSAAAAAGPGSAISAASTVRKSPRSPVVGVPGAGEVGLAEADQAVAADPGEELVGAVDRHHRPAAAEHLAAVRVRATSTVTSSRDDGGAEEPARDRGRRSRCAGPVGTSSSPGQCRPRAGGRGLRVIGDTPSWWWSGRGRTGSRRSHSQMPWAGSGAAPRSAAGAARSGL